MSDLFFQRLLISSLCSARVELRSEASRLFGYHGWMAGGWAACKTGLASIGAVMLPFWLPRKVPLIC
jgi:hypothetical protein